MSDRCSTCGSWVNGDCPKCDNINAPYRNKEWLEEKLITENKTYSEIANDINAGKSTIKDWAQKHNIEIDKEEKRWQGKRKETLNHLEEKGII